MPIYRNIHQALYYEACHLLNDAPTVQSRNGDAKEVFHRTITLTHPLERVQFHAARRASYSAMAAETLWLLAGRDDIEWLSYYLPRAPEFSDDGSTWRGAYGPRLRRWTIDGSDSFGNYFSVDQIANVLTELSEHPDSRRAVISLWDPAQDWVDSKDIPCNNWLHFLIRENKLHLSVATRSNDIWWGWSGINAFAWSVLQEAMAHWLGVGVGNYTTFAGSWHLYKRHWEAADKLVTNGSPNIPPTYRLLDDGVRPLFTTSSRQLDNALAMAFHIEKQLRVSGTRDSKLLEEHPDPLIRSLLLVMAAHCDRQLGKTADTLPQLMSHRNHSDIVQAQILFGR